MPTIAAEVRLPLIITADGSKAVAQLDKFKGQARSIDSQISGYFKGEAAAVGGMLSAYFGIQSAIDGLKELYAYSKKISEIAGTYSQPVAQAQAQTSIAQIQADQRVAAAVMPNEVQRAQVNTSSLQQSGTGFEQLASSFGLVVDQYLKTARTSISAIMDVFSGDMEAASAKFGISASSFADTWSSLLPDFVENFLYSFAPSSADISAASVSASTAGFSKQDQQAIAANDPTKAESLAALQAIARNTRGQR